MGMYDYIRCEVPLPVDLGVDTTKHWFQTKSVQCFMDHFEIREDKTLWFEKYDIEDRSDPTAKGTLRLAGCMYRVNKHWVKVGDFTGEIKFYTFPSELLGKKPDYAGGEWLEFSAYFVRGEMQQLELLTYKPSVDKVE